MTEPARYNCGESVSCGMPWCPQPDCLARILEERQFCVICGDKTNLQTYLATCDKHGKEHAKLFSHSCDQGSLWSFYRWAAKQKQKQMNSISKDTPAKSINTPLKTEKCPEYPKCSAGMQCDVLAGVPVKCHYLPTKSVDWFDQSKWPKSTIIPVNHKLRAIINGREVTCQELEWNVNIEKDETVCIIKTKENETKMAFKCTSCGYEDETRKTIFYCPACGIALEHGTDFNLRTVNHILQKEIEDLNIKYKAKVDELARVKAAYEIEFKMLSNNVARVNSLNEDLEAELAKLQQRSIPRKCRKCPLRPKKGQCKFLEKWWGIRGYFGATFCDSTERQDQLLAHKNKKDSPARESSLESLQKQYRKKQETEQKELKKIYTELEKVYYLVGTEYIFGIFRFEDKCLKDSSGCVLLEYCYEKYNVRDSRREYWQEHKNEILPTLTTYLKEQLKEAVK